MAEQSTSAHQSAADATPEPPRSSRPNPPAISGTQPSETQGAPATNDLERQQQQQQQQQQQSVQQQPTNPPLRQRLAARERNWIWKTSLRSILIVLNLIALGSSAWLLALLGPRHAGFYLSYGDVQWGWIYILVISIAAALWSAIWMLCLFFRNRKAGNNSNTNNNLNNINNYPPKRKYSSPHPALAVTFDLLLWIAFLIAGFIALIAYTATTYTFSGGEIQDPDLYNGRYDGAYYFSQSQDKWVYRVTYVYPSSNPPGTTVRNVVRNCEPVFSTCAAQDAFVNFLYREQGTRQAVELLLVVVMWVVTILEFVVFVWACVDTHRRRVGEDGVKAQRLAREMVRDLQARGLVVVDDGSRRGPGGAGAGEGNAGVQAPGYYDLSRPQDVLQLQQMMRERGIEVPTSAVAAVAAGGGGDVEKGKGVQADDEIQPVRETMVRFA